MPATVWASENLDADATRRVRRECAKRTTCFAMHARRVGRVPCGYAFTSSMLTPAFFNGLMMKKKTAAAVATNTIAASMMRPSWM